MISKYFKAFRYSKGKRKLQSVLSEHVIYSSESNDYYKDIDKKILETEPKMNDLKIITNTQLSVALLHLDIFMAQKSIDASKNPLEKSFYLRVFCLIIFEFLDDLDWIFLKDLEIAKKYFLFEKYKKFMKSLHSLQNAESRKLKSIRETIGHRIKDANTQLNSIKFVMCNSNYLVNLNSKITDCLIEHYDLTNQILEKIKKSSNGNASTKKPS